MAVTLTGPVCIVPIAIAVALTTDVLIESNFNMILPPGRFSFLRGSDDYGCSNLFAGAMALCVTFGFLATWYLTLRLSESEPSTNTFRDVGRSLWILKFHMAAFVVGGYMFAGGCDETWGNDFRNTLVLAGLVYVLTGAMAVFIYRLRWLERTRLVLAPTMILLWVVMGSDGMTPKTAQNRSGDQISARAHSRRHEVMLAWYELCERTLGRGRQ